MKYPPLIAAAVLCNCITGHADATDSGAMAAAKILSHRITAAGTLNLVRIENGTIEFRLDERVIHSERDALRAAIASSTPSAGPANILLVRIASGGSVCPAEFVVLDFEITPPLVTRHFGNCSDVPRVEPLDDGLRISFPRFDSNDSQTWRYEHGRLRRADN